MPARLIGYDLSKSGQEYESLFAEIKKLGAWWHHLDSTWIVVTELSPSQIRDRLGRHIDQNDELAVFGLDGIWATKGIKKKGNSWLHKYL